MLASHEGAEVFTNKGQWFDRMGSCFPEEACVLHEAAVVEYERLGFKRRRLHITYYILHEGTAVSHTVVARVAKVGLGFRMQGQTFPRVGRGFKTRYLN